MGVEGGGGAEKEIIELLPHLKLWISGDEEGDGMPTPVLGVESQSDVRSAGCHHAEERLYHPSTQASWYTTGQ